jgi:cytidine deaminase
MTLEQRRAQSDPKAALLAAALAARANAYARYSGFAVGAAVLTEAGDIFAGANVENVSYPVGTCAEAGAVAAMVAAGGRRIVEALVVSAGGEATPCGACRQRLREFAHEATPIHTASLDGIVRTNRLGTLLPDAFTAFGRDGSQDQPA